MAIIKPAGDTIPSDLVIGSFWNANFDLVTEEDAVWIGEFDGGTQVRLRFIRHTVTAPP